MMRMVMVLMTVVMMTMMMGRWWSPTFTSAVGSLRYTFSGSLRTFLPATTITTTTTTAAENVVFL